VHIPCASSGTKQRLERRYGGRLPQTRHAKAKPSKAKQANKQRMKWKEETKQNKTKQTTVLLWCEYYLNGSADEIYGGSRTGTPLTPSSTFAPSTSTKSRRYLFRPGWLATAKSQAAMVTRPEQTRPPAAFYCVCVCVREQIA
jgi:hypothetical protein